MQAWLPLVDAFLARLGFDRPAIVGRPPASRYAELGDASKVPINAQSKATGYAQFLQARLQGERWRCRAPASTVGRRRHSHSGEGAEAGEEGLRRPRRGVAGR